MLRPFLGLAAVGVIGYVAWQVIWAVLLPLLGTVVGFVLLLIKLFFVLLLIGVGLWIFKRLAREEPNTA